MSSPFEIFKNALVYSVCSQIVSTVVQTSDDANSLIVLIVVFAFIIKGIMEFKAYMGTHQRALLSASSAPRAYHEVIKLLVFLVDVSINIAVQFESTLVARVSVAALSPASDHLGWVATLSIMSLMLLWLLNESVAISR